MAIDKKTLQKLLDNPAMVSGNDVDWDQLENMELPPDVPVQEQSPAEEEVQPEEMIEPEIEPELEDEEVAAAEPQGQPIDESRRKLHRPKGYRAPWESKEDDLTDEEAKNTAEDMQAPVELRKKALQRIKQKYLGQ